MDQASRAEPVRFAYARCGHHRVGLPGRVLSVEMPRVASIGVPPRPVTLLAGSALDKVAILMIYSDIRRSEP
jgi:hypothetical protein